MNDNKNRSRRVGGGISHAKHSGRSMGRIQRVWSPSASFKNVLVFDFEKMKPITLTRTKQKEKCVDHWIKPARKSYQVAENYLRLRSIRRELISVGYCFSFLYKV